MRVKIMEMLLNYQDNFNNQLDIYWLYYTSSQDLFFTY